MSEHLEDQIRRQTRAMYEQAPPIEDLLPSDMADGFDVEQTPSGTVTLEPIPPAKRVRGWVAAAIASVAVLAFAIPTVIWLGTSDEQPGTQVSSTTIQTPRPGMVQNPGNGHFYEVVIPDVALDWFDIRTEAESRSFRGVIGHLATITSEEEDLWFQQAFADVLGDTVLGGFQPEGSAEPAGGWQWVTGEPFHYTNWADGEPNDDGNPNCMRYLEADPPAWMEVSCRIATIYIVEYDIPPD